MRCSRVRKILPQLLDSPEAQPGVRAHLAACPACRQEFLLLQRTSSALRTAEEAPPAPANFAAGVMARISAAEQPGGNSRWNWLAGWKQLVAAAAAILILAVGVLALVRAAGPGVSEIAGTPPAITQQPEVRPGTEEPKPNNTRQPDNGTPEEQPETQPSPEPPTPAKQPEPEATEKKPAPVQERQTAIAAGRTVFFLSQQRVLRSTLLRLEVQDLKAAGEKALATARTWGANGGCVADTTDGQRRIQAFHFQVAPDKSEGFITALGALGTVIEREDDHRNITDDFNQAQAEYESLAGSRNTAPESEQAAIDARLTELEKQLVEWDALANKWIVTLCLIQ